MLVFHIPFTKFAACHLSHQLYRLIDIRLMVRLGFQGRCITVFVVSDDPGGHGQPLSKKRLRTETVRRLRRLPVRGSVADRKSTRLNSSHVKSSYAVCCLTKNKTYTT